ncbi:37647_t:CDS:2, partial [Gigaspora margarita]
YDVVYYAQWGKKCVALKHIVEVGNAESEHKVLIKTIKALISIKSTTSMECQTKTIHENIFTVWHAQNVAINPDNNGIRIITDFGTSNASSNNIVDT